MRYHDSLRNEDLKRQENSLRNDYWKRNYDLLRHEDSLRNDYW